MNPRQKVRLVCAALCLCLAQRPAGAAPITLSLEPAYARVTFRAYAMGLFPLDGAFGRFSGTLSVDPMAPWFCRVALDVEVGSLDMNDRSMRDDVLAPSLLDAPNFPRLGFEGVCDGRDVLRGALTLHGETHDLSLAVTRVGDEVSAEAILRRADWGVRGRPLLAGPTIRIRVTTRLPPDAAPATPAP